MTTNRHNMLGTTACFAYCLLLLHTCPAVSTAMSFYYKQEISIASDPWTQWKFHALMTTHEGGLKVTLVWKKFPKIFYEQDIYIEDPTKDQMWIMEKLITDLKREKLIIQWRRCEGKDEVVEYNNRAGEDGGETKELIHC
jgi:hypothetical protein